VQVNPNIEILNPIHGSILMNLFDFVDDVQVISLVRSQRRRELLRFAFEQVNTPDYSVFDAVDGRVVDLEKLKRDGELVVRPSGPNRGHFLTHGHAGCVLSHRAIWKHHLDSKNETVLVCEDDITWHHDSIAQLSRFFSHIEGWDMVYLHSHFSVEARPRELIAGNCYLANDEHGGTLCYAINRRVAEYLLKISWPLMAAVDGTTSWVSGDWSGGGCELGFKSYLCYPFPCQSIGDQSTIFQKPTMVNRIANRILRLLQIGFRQQGKTEG
jgi:GR25 family glycosyltransferase involved in LPS biosynthesis